VVQIVLATPPDEALSAAKLAAGNHRMDMADAVLHAMTPIDCPLEHRFTPGMYSRQMSVTKGTLLSSKIHKSTHQFILSTGHVSVWTEGEGVVHMVAPFHGTTTPGTRRMIFAHEDSVWTTFHPTNETDLDKIESDLIYPHNHYNPELIAEVRAALGQSENSLWLS